MEENIFRNSDDEKKSRAVLVGVQLRDDEKKDTENSLSELEDLLDTAGGECAAVLIQTKSVPDPATYIGSGKADELKKLCEDTGSELIVFDTELTPSQISNLEKITNVHVIDRSMLILDIFALHAASGEGKLQVELAQLKYTIPRLTGKGKELSRLGGGIGTRGPGESKLETDKRHIMRRMAALEEEIREIERGRDIRRSARERSGTFCVAIVGYTNAGKSTLLNALTGAGILAEDKLFATLDTTTRRYKLPSGTEILLTDTVGFIKKLPHHLIKAFRSTLDEVRYSDALLILADATDDDVREKLEVTSELIEELGAEDKPRIYVFNKCDIAGEKKQFLPMTENTVFISAKTGDGLCKLAEKLDEAAGAGKYRIDFLFPQDAGAELAKLYRAGAVIGEAEYTEDGTLVHASVDAELKGRLSRYIVG